MQKKTHLLIVVDSIDINDSSGSKANVALIQNLHKAGFHLKVLHYTRKKIELDDICCVTVKEQKWTLWYLLAKLLLFVKRVTNLNLNKNVESLWGFSFSFFNDSYSIKKALQKENPNDFDWILTLSKAASFRPHKALLELPQWHSKWLAYIHDPYPMHSYPRPYDWVEPGHKQKRKFFLQVSENCRYALYPSQLLGEWMEGYYHPLQGKAKVIPHQLSTVLAQEAALPKFFESDKFTILHAGTLLWGRDPMGLIMAFLKFIKNYPEAQKDSSLLFIGGINYYSTTLENLAAKHSQIFVSKDYIAFDVVQKMQMKASVNVILEAKGPLSPFLPGKFPHCIAAGRPILLLGPLYSESRRLLKEEYPYWSEIDDVDHIYSHLVELYKFWKLEPNKQKQDFGELQEYLSEGYLATIVLDLKK